MSEPKAPDSALRTPHSALEWVRPAVRREQPYRVGGGEGAEIKLNQNESPFDLPPELKQEIVEEFLRIPWNRYPLEQAERLRAALAGRLELDPEGILIGNGSNELTYTFGLTLVDRDTPVVLPRPMFSLYEKVVRLYDGRLVSVGPRPDLSFDAEALVRAVRAERPALTVLTAPNNPTGRDMTLEEIEGVVDASPGIVVVDEAYIEFTDRPSARGLLDRYPNLILLRTFSKVFGLAGMRVGYIFGRPELMREINKSRVPFMVDRLSETTALTLLRNEALVRERVAFLRRERDRMRGALEALEGIRVIPSSTNFLTFRSPIPPAELVRRLRGDGVLLRDVSGYPGLEGYVRVNAGLEAENRAFVSALEEELRKDRGAR